MNTRPCKACGRMLTFAHGPNGSTIPLEKVTKPYSIEWDGVTKRYAAIPRDFAEDVYVSHFSTCPEAGRFSKKNQQQTQLPLQEGEQHGKGKES